MRPLLHRLRHQAHSTKKKRVIKQKRTRLISETTQFVVTTPNFDRKK